MLNWQTVGEQSNSLVSGMSVRSKNSVTGNMSIKSKKKQILTSDPLAALQVQKKSRLLRSRNPEEIYSVTRENPLFIDETIPPLERSNSNGSDKNLSDSSGYGSVTQENSPKSRVTPFKQRKTSPVRSFTGNFEVVTFIDTKFEESNDFSSLNQEIKKRKETKSESPETDTKATAFQKGIIYQNSDYVQNIVIRNSMPSHLSYNSLGDSNFVFKSLPSHQAVPPPIFPQRSSKRSFGNLSTPQNSINYINQNYVANILIPNKSSALNNTESLLDLSYCYNSVVSPGDELLRDGHSGEEAIKELSESLGRSRSLITVTNALKDSHYVNFDSYTSHFYATPNSDKKATSSDEKGTDDERTNYIEVDSSATRKVTFSEEMTLVENIEYTDEVFYENEKAASDGNKDSKGQVHEHLNLSQYGVFMAPIKKEKSVVADQQRMWESYYGVPTNGEDHGRYANGPFCGDNSVCVDFTLDAQRLALIAKKERHDTVCRRVCCTAVVLLGLGVFVIVVVGVTIFFTQVQQKY